MYRISYEKCVCFIFLVILAILSCSGVRIDNLAMTDISKRNSHTLSTSLFNSDEFLYRFFMNTTTSPNFRHHKIRHHRQLKAQAHTTRPTPFNEPYVQIASTDLTQLPTKSHVQRSTRNNNNSNKQKKKKTKIRCPDYDITWKYCQADTVVLAKVESKTSSCKDNCVMVFRKIKVYKSPSPNFPIDDRIRIKLPLKRNRSTCEYDDLIKRSKFLVRTEINQSTEYILFLDAFGAHNFTAVFAPEPNKSRNIIKMKNKCQHKEKLLTKTFPKTSKRLRFVCKARGRPIPIMYWEKNGVLIYPNQPFNPRLKITNKKRRSTLVIRKPEAGDSGRYECLARRLDEKLEIQHFDYNVRSCNVHLKKKCKSDSACNVKTIKGEEICICPDGWNGDSCRPKRLNNSTASASTSTTTILSTSRNTMPSCQGSLDRVYCENGGTCHEITKLREIYCVCPDGYEGKRCESKTTLNNSSRYRQTPKYTCSEGIYTNYDNCR